MSHYLSETVFSESDLVGDSKSENSDGQDLFEIIHITELDDPDVKVNGNSSLEPNGANTNKRIKEIKDEELIEYFKEMKSAMPLTAIQELKISAKIKSCKDKLEEITFLEKNLLNHRRHFSDGLVEINIPDNNTLEKIHLLKLLSSAYSNLLLEYREKFIRANLRLVLKLANKYRGRAMHLADLIQEGNIGLIKAVDKFDYQLGYKFSTYAAWWIKQSILRAIMSHTRIVSIPVGLLEQRSRAFKVASEYVNKTGENMLPEEIGKELNLSPTYVKRIIEIPHNNIKSMDSPLFSNESVTLHDIIPDMETNPVDSIISQKELKIILEEAMLKLNPREVEVLRMRFGIGAYSIFSLEQIAQQYGLTRERIRQIEKKALNKIKKLVKWRLIYYFED